METATVSLAESDILNALSHVEDPELRRDLVSLGRVDGVALQGDAVQVGIKIDAMPAEARESLRREIEAAIRAVSPTIHKVDVAFTASLLGQAEASESPQASGGQPDASGNPLPHVKHIIAVGAGKGGVGKSTLAVNLAVALARNHGARVGLLDGDIYGPSIPTMLGTDRFEPQARGDTLLPFEVHGISTMSIGSLVEDDQALIWRGPMAHGAFQQLATQTAWGELDYLIIDLPPGTGDVPLTMSQLLPLTGAVIVCTPQKVAQDDARRAVKMFEQLKVPLLGLVENMSCFIGDDGKLYDLFGQGGAEMLATQIGVPFLGAVPIDPQVRLHGDAGDPTANFTKQGPTAKAFTDVGSKLISQIGLAALEQQEGDLEITVS